MSAEIPDGAVIVARAILNSSLWTMRFEDRVLAMTCIALSNWQDARWFDGQKPIIIRRGQFVRSREELAKAANMSVQQVRTSLKNLERSTFLTRKSTKTYTLYTLPKYDYYQDLANYSDSSNPKVNQPLTQPQPNLNPDLTQPQPRPNHKQEGEEGKEGEEKRRPPSAARSTQEDPELALTIESFSAWEIPGSQAKEKAVRELIRQGVTHAKIRAGAKQNPQADFYAIFDKLKNGKAKPPFLSSVPSGVHHVNPDEHDQKNERIVQIDKLLLDMKKDEYDSWVKEAREKAVIEKVYGPATAMFIQAELRQKMARKEGIPGI